MHPTVRPATPADQPSLIDLYSQLHPADPPWPSDEAAAGALSNVIGHPGATILVCEADGRVVSTCVLFVVPNFSRAGRPIGMIENVVTHRDYRKRGLGRQVVQRAIEIARQSNCYKVMLMTGSRNEATLRFYETAGMQRGTKTAFEARFI
jgi:GNAT superfamily N-acetyltransferase